MHRSPPANRRPSVPSESPCRSPGSNVMRLALATLAALVAVPAARAGDWPQWLGPNRDGTSSEVVKPWTGDLKVPWRKPAGEGHSSPIVAGGKVYLHYASGPKDNVSEKVVVHDAVSGDLVHENEV